MWLWRTHYCPLVRTWRKKDERVSSASPSQRDRRKSVWFVDWQRRASATYRAWSGQWLHSHRGVFLSKHSLPRASWRNCHSRLSAVPHRRMAFSPSSATVWAKFWWFVDHYSKLSQRNVWFSPHHCKHSAFIWCSNAFTISLQRRGETLWKM